MMEKIGVEQVEVEDQNTLIKTAGRGHKKTGCEHPQEYIQTDGETRFCGKCEKYLVRPRS